ncbi:MAG: anaerobic sulfatase maturase [Spirochaetales bacterium]|jgi:uncharacterized protein|nr:anaerobic sulfatase maturase [Spirochaetales bacterium]
MDTCSAPFNIIIKPIGSVCNLRCDYCYYLDKYKIVMGENEKTQSMSDELLEMLTQEYINSQPENAKEIVFSWQGGEPTLRGISFFERALQLQRKYARKGLQISNALQTNGTLLTPDFARFFRDNNFLVGLSIDGPENFHNRYRKDAQGKGSFAGVMKGLDLLRQYNVEYNTLTAVQPDNGAHPEEVYAFLTGTGSRFLQFIPIVETAAGKAGQGSVRPDQWGTFLSGVFDEWLVGDIGTVFIQQFDLLLSRYMGYSSSLCVHAQTCGRNLALEHNGNLYSCDHFVDPQHLLGNIQDQPLCEMVDSEQQGKFGQVKHEGLADACRQCEFLQLCFGGCLRNRIPSRDAGNSLNYLCSGYKHFYRHTKPYMLAMKRAIDHGKYAVDYAKFMGRDMFEHVGRNELCPCGSGKKFKYCHGL